MGKFINFYYSLYKDIDKKISMIKKAGFEGVFLFCDRTANKSLMAKFEKNNLKVETLHLPYQDICNNLWVKGLKGERYKRTMIKGVKKAHRLNVKTVIMHISSGNNPPELNVRALDRINQILEYCEKYKINLALENLRRLDYLDYIYDNCKSEYLKFCFDSGHANAFTKNIETFPWDKYKDKLQCLHLHDNLGDFDDHILPFTGNINWKHLINDLNKINYKGNLTLEVIRDFEKDNFDKEIDFLNSAFSKVSKLDEMRKNG